MLLQVHMSLFLKCQKRTGSNRRIGAEGNGKPYQLDILSTDAKAGSWKYGRPNKTQEMRQPGYKAVLEFVRSDA